MKRILKAAFLASSFASLAGAVDLDSLLHAYDRPAPSQAQAAAPAAGEAAPSPAADAWTRLRQGNSRHQKGRWQHPHLNLARREGLAQSQSPYAMVLSCADSRVAPELVFDQGLGDLFVVRVAGNVAGPFDRASLEYGAGHLGIGLLLVLGHERCGAVKAALESGSHAAGLSPDLEALVREIGPATAGKQGSQLDEAVKDNARLSLKRLLEQSQPLREAVETGRLKAVAARYDLDSGAVEELP